MKLKAIILATGLINCIAFSAQAVDSTITVTGNVYKEVVLLVVQVVQIKQYLWGFIYIRFNN